MNGFVIGNHTNANRIGDETLGLQTNSFSNSFGRIEVSEISPFQVQAVEKDIDEKIGKSVDNAVMAVKNRVHNATFDNDGQRCNSAS